MTPVQALERVVHCLDRMHDTGFRTKAFVRALDVVRATPADELAERSAAGTLTELDGIGDSSARVISEALTGEVPSYLVKQLSPLEGATPITIEDYVGGHMLYLRPESRRALEADVEAMYERALRSAPQG